MNYFLRAGRVVVKLPVVLVSKVEAEAEPFRRLSSVHEAPGLLFLAGKRRNCQPEIGGVRLAALNIFTVSTYWL